MKGRVLIVAGSDSGGGAGIQADIKTVTVLGGFAMTAITALTAQNTQAVHGVWSVSPEFIQQQMRVVLEDIGADCIKIGMLHSAEVVEAVAAVLKTHAAQTPLVIDPVMVAKGGESLLHHSAVDALKTHLIARATVVTPNRPEAEALCGLKIEAPQDYLRAADKLLSFGAQAVLLKGGHAHAGADPTIVEDWLFTQDDLSTLTTPRLFTRHTHGTGCTLASAIAHGLACGMDLKAAVVRARDYVVQAIASAPGFGAGHGPLNHAWPITGVHALEKPQPTS